MLAVAENATNSTLPIRSVEVTGNKVHCKNGNISETVETLLLQATNYYLLIRPTQKQQIQ